jgi:hypothetical protein
VALLALAAHASAQDGAFGTPPGWLSALLSDGWQEARREAMEEPLATDRPDFTEASSVVGWGVAQVETGYTYVYRDDNREDTLTQSHNLPEMLWRVGIHEDVEIRLFWNYLWERTTGGGAVSTPEGAEDLVVGFKFALTEQDALRPEAALIVDMSVPTGARAFRIDDPQAGFNLLYGWDLPRDFSLAGSTGFATQHEDVPLGAGFDGDGHGVFHQSATVGIPVAESVGMYLEYFGLYTVARDENFPENYVDGGFTYKITGDVQLDARAGKGLNSQADDFFGGVGLSLRF